MLKFLQLPIDTFIPTQCILCDKLSFHGVCNDCLPKLKSKPIIIQRENSDNNITSLFTNNNNTTLTKFHTKKYLNTVLCTNSFKNSALKKAVHYFKYKNLISLDRILGQILLETLKSHLSKDYKSNLIFAPIPLHINKLKFRGYNQSNLLAEFLQKNIPNSELFLNLQRIKNNSPQMSLSSKQERVKNVIDIFKCEPNNDYIDKDIILIDDVTTTLSTLDEAAKALQRSGFRNVFALVIAK